METFIVLLTGIFGATITFFINCYLAYGPVRSSSIASLATALFFYAFPNLFPDFYTHTVPLVFIGGSFIGMVSYRVMKNVWLVPLSGLVFSFFYINSASFFSGYGGALGTAACISIIVVLGFYRILRLFKLRYKKQRSL
ncbi:hypothetical protein [Galbibacter sp. PAP.153]|uniref:hypothetical protein n=1 Tax=Galbibacter sp. PAP.153 TaxID=3104623 RepID=UPI003009B324